MGLGDRTREKGEGLGIQTVSRYQLVRGRR